METPFIKLLLVKTLRSSETINFSTCFPVAGNLELCTDCAHSKSPFIMATLFSEYAPYKRRYLVLPPFYFRNILRVFLLTDCFRGLNKIWCCIPKKQGTNALGQDTACLNDFENSLHFGTVTFFRFYCHKNFWVKLSNRPTPKHLARHNDKFFSNRHIEKHCGCRWIL